MTEEQQNIQAAVRAVLQRNGVFMTRNGPVGPEDVDKRILSGVTREAAIEVIAACVARGEQS